MKRTALYQKHLDLHAKMVEFAGFEMPISYKGIQEEHNFVRTHMGIFDVSHMGEFLIEGEDALEFANHILTNRISNELHKVTYSLLCDEQGLVIDDLLAYVMKENQVLLVPNAANIEKDFAWIESHIKDYDVKLRNVSDAYSQVAIQGPEAARNIAKILGEDLSNLPFMTYTVIPYNGAYIIVSATGYTGENGYEVYGPHDSISKIWDRAIEVGVEPCGLGVRDTLRFEAGLPLYGNEIGGDINPYEAGLGFAIKLDKDFIGKEALAKAKENLTRKSVGLELLERGIPRHGYLVLHEDKVIGHVTTGYMIPGLETPVAVALVDINYSKIGTELFVQIRGKNIKARVRNKKFLIKK